MTATPLFGSRRLELAALWGAFAVVHLVLGLVNLFSTANPFGDVRDVYPTWLGQAFAGQVPAIDAPWVYPVLALVPMLAAHALALLFGGASWYGVGWLLVVAACTAVTLAVMTGGRHSPAAARVRLDAAWFLVLFQLVLGPISTGRIDAITLPFAVLGLLALRRSGALSGGLLALGAWIKVWPAAPFLAVVIGHRHWLRAVAGGAIVSVLVVGVAVLLGGWPAVLSFVTEQTGRGLQIEAPAALWPMLLTSLGVPGFHAGYDLDILTYQVTGPGTAAISAWTTPVMAVAVLAVAGLGIAARRAGAGFVRVVPVVALGLVLALIVANKVGSPQFVGWIGAVVAVGLVWDARRFRVPAILALAIAGFTQLIYPWNYAFVADAMLPGVILLAFRTVVYFVLLWWTVRALQVARRDAMRATAHRRG